MFNHIGTIFGPSLCPDQLKLWNFQDWVNIVLGPYLWIVYYLQPCQGQVWTMLGSSLAFLHYQTSYSPEFSKAGSTSSKAHVLGASTLSGSVRALSGPCVAWLYIRATRNSEISKTEFILPNAYVWNVHYSGLCQGNVWTIWWACLALLYICIRLSFKICKTDTTWHKAHIYKLSTFWDHVRAF